MMKSLCLALIGICSALSLSAQVDLFGNMSMRSVGPSATSGRVTAIDVVLDDPNIFYVGTASGGLWISEDAGTTWSPIFDNQPVLSIGAVKIFQKNPSIIWAGTGEGNPRNSQNSGTGVFKSIDGGKTWKFMGLKESKAIHRIILHPENPEIAWVAALGSSWGPNTERGVFKTTDGGRSWSKVLYVNEQTGCAEIIMDPANPNKLIAAMWEFGRKPYTFNSGGPGSGLYISFDGGATWEVRTSKHGLPEGELGRIGLAISGANPSRVYALIESARTGLYRSDDGGYKWEFITSENIGNRPFYYAEIHADPLNENRLYNLYSVVSMSEDGGKTFETILPYWGIHPDHHAMWIHPEKPEFILEGNDGGLSISRDGGKNWQFINNLPLGQFYHINFDRQTPYNIYGGMQDNGSWKGPGFVWHEDGIRNEDWLEVLFGDGFDVVPNASNPDHVYAMYQGGNVYSVDTKTGRERFIKPVNPEGVILRFNWNAGISEDPFNPKGVYFGSQYLHYSPDEGRSWQIISPDLTTNDTTWQKQAQSGGLTTDATNAENYTTVISIAPSALDANVIWVGTDDGNVQLTRDKGHSWTNFAARIKGLPANAWITQIVASSHLAGEAFVVANNYRRNDWAPYVFHTRDFGKSWVRIVDNTDVPMHCLSIVQDPVEPGLLFLGTESGLYYSLNYGADWKKWSRDFPSVPVSDLKIQPDDNDLIIGTFGRAAYILDDIRPMRLVASGAFDKDKAIALDGSPVWQVTFRRPFGIRFTGDHHFKGDNKSPEARIPVYLPEAYFNTKDTTKAEREKKIKVSILNNRGDTVRTFKAQPDTGWFFTRWGGESNGFRFPQRSERKKDSDLPGGWPVMPGMYTVRIDLSDGNSLMSNVEVRPDPRMDVELPSEELKGARQRFESLVGQADSLFEQLKFFRKSIARVTSDLGLLPGNIADSLRKEAAELGKELNRLEERYMLPENFVGYEDVTQRLMDYIYSSWFYLSADRNELSGNTKESLHRLNAELQSVTLEISRFILGKWLPWRRAVERQSFDYFRNE